AAHARAGLEALARDYKEIIRDVHGAGVMLAFDVVRTDLRDALLDRTFRRGLVLLAAGERTVRLYPRYDTEPASIDEALSLLRQALEDLVPGRLPAEPPPAPKIRVGTLAIPLDTLETIDLTPATFEQCKQQIAAVEQERYGTGMTYPPDVLRTGPRPLLQFPIETLEATIANPRAYGVALRDRVAARLVGYAPRSRLGDHYGGGGGSDPHFGENSVFYLQAMATMPMVQNEVELENLLLDTLRERLIAAGFEYLSTLIEERVRETAPAWLRNAAVLERIDNYLRSGVA